MNRRITKILASLILVGGLAACGDDASGTSTDHNAADVSFATDMIPHHAQAVEMAEFASTRAADPAVTDLAAQIQAAQDPEIQTMSGWLKEWGEKVPSADMGGMGGMDSSMPGMMTDEQMAELGSMDGQSFDKMFLQMMREHHQGAIEMAKTEQAEGMFAAATSLAAEIEKAQTAEIATIDALLAK